MNDYGKFLKITSLRLLSRCAWCLLILAQAFSCTSFEFNNPYHLEEKGSGGYTGSYGSVSHGGKSYKTVKIGTQTWMAENLNYDVEGSKCYDDDPANCDKYGRLYDWATVMALPSSCNNSECGGQVQPKHKGICPSGWHIPSDDDWTTLLNSAGGGGVAGAYLKAQSGWDKCGPSLTGPSIGDIGVNYYCMDSYGFAALPGGYGFSDGGFSGAGNYGHWWSSTEDYANDAYSRYMYYNLEDVYRNDSNKAALFSVRCLQDSAP